MKKRMYLFIALFAGASGLYAQDCATGYCPSTIVVHHKIGDLSAETKDITYNVVKITSTAAPTCWITQNLGATTTPTAFSDYGAAYDGWLYQGGLKKGYLNSVAGMSAAMTVVSIPVGSSWQSTEDPCTLTFGAAWHVPTISDYSSGNWATWATGFKPNYSPTYSWVGVGPWFNNGNYNGVYALQGYGTTGSGLHIIYWNSAVAYTEANMYTTSGVSMRCVKLASK